MTCKITVLIPTFNEEDRIRGCLESVRWADEILVVDSFSTDRTLEIVGEYGSRILQHEYESHASQLNWAISQATHAWILILDADERVSPELQRSLLQLRESNPAHSVYSIKRKNYFFGQEIKHGGWGHDWIFRFFHRDQGKYEECGYHGKFRSKQKPTRIQGTIDHCTYRSLDDYFRKFHLYTTEGARILDQKNKKIHILHLTLHPCWRFFHMYILRLGFLDGIPGLIVCTLASFYVFTKYVKLWYFQTSRTV